MMSYSFDQLRTDIIQGHEISFLYDSSKYGISQGETGQWYLAKYISTDIQQFPSQDELLINATIEGRNLQDIWDQVEVTGIF